VGVIAYVLLAGADPVAASARDWKGVKLRPPPFTPRTGLHLPRAYVQLVESLIHPDPARRPRFAAEVRDRIAELEPGVVEEAAVSSGRAMIAFVSAPTADADTLRPPSQLESAPTQMIPLSQAPTLSTDSSASTLNSRSSGVRTVAPPPPELPFALPAPEVLETTASLVRLRSPQLVARRAEQRLCLELVAKVCSERRPALLSLSGEAGVGKSRVARWLLAEVERRGVMESTAAGYDVSGTSEGLRSALARVFGTNPKNRIQLPSLELEKLEAWLALEAPVRPGHAERIALTTKSLIALSRVRPLVVWFDDAAWSRDGALEVALELLDAEDAPILLVVTLRSGTAEHPQVRARLDALRSHARVLEHDVPRLDPAARREVLSAVAPLRSDVTHELAELLDETPFLLVQLVHDLIESEALVASADGFAPPAGQSVAEIVAARPATRLLSERIAKLVTGFGERAADAEAVLIRAALLGHHFEEKALRAAAKGVRSRFVQTVIAKSLLHGIWRAERGERHRFEHDLLREAMQNRLATRRDRAELLISTAEGLLAAYGVGRPEIHVQAAQLLHEAGDLDAALERLFVAVDDSALLVDPANEEYRKLARSWVEAAPTPGRRARLSALEGTADYFLSRYDSALAHLAEGRVLARQIGDQIIELKCLTAEAGVLFYQSRFSDAGRVAAEVLAACPPGDPQFAEHGMNAAHRLAEIAVLRGELDEAGRLYQLALEYSKHIPGALREPHMALALAELELARGRVDATRVWLDALAPQAHEPESGAWRELYFDTELKWRVCIGQGGEANDEIKARIAELEQRGDVWRLTAFRVLHALAVTELSAAQAASASDAMLLAFDVCSNEKPFTLWALGEVLRRLEALGLSAQASRVRVLIEAQRARFAVASGGPQ
jgi:hypothetical protein